MNPSSIINFDRYDALMERSFLKHLGKVTKVVGLTIESIGPEAKLNDLCIIRSNSAVGAVKAEVVGFREDRVLLMTMSRALDWAAGLKIQGRRCRFLSAMICWGRLWMVWESR